jgi:hypothetical protein
MASAFIVTRTTSSRGKRYLVRYRLGGRTLPGAARRLLRHAERGAGPS